MRPTSRNSKLVFVAGCILMTAFFSVVKSVRAGDKEDENPYLWKSKVNSVAVFKNGLGFFIRQGKVELRDGWCVAREVPPAAFGTLAIYSANKDHLVDIVGSGPGEIVDFDGTDAPDNAEYKRKRLLSNINLRVEITYTQKGSKRTAAGKVVSVGPKFLVLDGPENNFAVPLEGISRMQILDLPVRVHVQDEAEKTPNGTELGMAYLRKGITWIPEYTVKILDDTTAELTLRGTLVNEAEDLIHCDINFVVGVPHFLHTDYMAPIAVGQAIRTIGAAVAPPQISNQIMNRAAFANNAAASNQFNRYEAVDRAVAASGGDLGNVLGNLPKMESAAATDYTVYTKKDMSIRRGEKAIVTLFVKKIKYSHIYRWSPPKRMQHFLVLHNATDTAWTTGPYLAVSGDQPLSEDLLRYTPVGGKCEIPVTHAVNIAHEQSESEIDRKLKAHSPRRERYLDLVTLEGKLQLRNFERDTVTVVISVSVPGKPIFASDDGDIHADPTKLQLTGRAGTVEWVVKLKSRQSTTLTYKYERYVNSG